MKITITQSTSVLERNQFIIDALTVVFNKAKLPLDGVIFTDALKAIVSAFSNAEYKGGDAVSGYGEGWSGNVRALVNDRSGEIHMYVNIEAL